VSTTADSIDKPKPATITRISNRHGIIVVERRKIQPEPTPNSKTKEFGRWQYPKRAVLNSDSSGHVATPSSRMKSTTTKNLAVPGARPLRGPAGKPAVSSARLCTAFCCRAFQLDVRRHISAANRLLASRK
jgi:hypothetical protein